MRQANLRILAALILLFAAGFDLLIVDFAIPAFCNENQGSNSFTDADCFCCCSHIVLVRPPLLQPVEAVAFTDFAPLFARPIVAYERIYHPPRTGFLTA